MNVSQLEYLVATMDSGSFADAAKSLYISPQAVLKAISDLEKELNLELFARVGRGIAPTACGELLAKRALDIMQGFADFKNIADSLVSDSNEDSKVRGAARIAVTSSPYEGCLIPRSFFDQFSKKYPGVSVSLSYSSSGSCLSALQEGIIDAAIILGRYSGESFVCTRIFDSVLKVAVGVGNPLSRKELITLADTKAYPICKPHDLRYCLPVIEKHFTERHFNPLFVELPPTTCEYTRFFDKDDGIVFVSYDQSLDDIFPDVYFKDLVKEDQIKIPVCFVFPGNNENRVNSLLQKNLVKSIKTEYSLLNFERKNSTELFH